MPDAKPRFRFAAFVLSPAQRVLLKDGREIPLIPRYLDLLLLLIERRHEAVHRREILDRVWSDVVVSDGALSQAVRTLRRALGDTSRDAVFIRTLSRHGYRFVFDPVIEEPDEGPLPSGPQEPPAARQQPEDAFDSSLSQLLGKAHVRDEDEEAACRAAAERLHGLGTAESLRRLGRRTGHAAVRAWLRDTRWDSPASGPVPILGQPASLEVTAILVGMRVRRALRLAGRRWLAAALGGALSGLAAGLLGGLVLLLGPGSTATASVLVALPIVGYAIGGMGAFGVGGGLAVAESVIRSFRGSALVGFGALGGGLVGWAGHMIASLASEGLFGRDLSPAAGGLEGLVIGAATGLGYALATRRAAGLATPRGTARLRVAALAALVCGAATLALTLTGSYLGAMSLDFMARNFPGSQVSLDPLSRLLGEATPGRITLTAIGAWEGLMFGFGVILGLTHRPRPRDGAR